MMRNKE